MASIIFSPRVFCSSKLLYEIYEDKKKCLQAELLKKLWNSHISFLIDDSNYEKEELDILKNENRLHIPKTKNSKLYKKIYLSENPGKPCTDLWDDVHSIAQGGELRKYPTAKPVALLERIIRISTEEGDLVLDPMCGSGTTGEACKNLNRRCILIDKNEEVLPILEARFK